uniref:Uncharacterized protein n=1 Tax=Anopheles albimanus TaxID=7167 RepID=A0A182FGD6_ANOAL
MLGLSILTGIAQSAALAHDVPISGDPVGCRRKQKGKDEKGCKMQQKTSVKVMNNIYTQSM